MDLARAWDPTDRVLEAARNGERLDGRLHNEGRPLTIQTSIFKKVYGSASVRRGKAYYFSCATASIGILEALPAVQVKLQLPHILGCEFGLNRQSDAHLKNQNIEMTLNTWPDCVCEQVSRILSNSLQQSALEVFDYEKATEEDGPSRSKEQLKYRWLIQIDVTCLNYEGNLFDQVLLCALGALLDIRIPQVTWDSERRWWKASEDGSQLGPLLTYYPIPVTLSRVGAGALLVDADREESTIGFPMSIVYMVPVIFEALNMDEDDDSILLNFLSIAESSTNQFTEAERLVPYCEPCAQTIFTAIKKLTNSSNEKH
eukprot:Protomagalhaensia_wolfi_Nauph_80__5883@NODE_760_length_2023_cov_26_120464_g571_i0_p1_GENE_NODE_760_length_2023_cov_26_120464_g571_i0NODE_760_length_2023_cov_26_120464_g571_i0_p1_ORF_typecomplete_len315_score50_84RNase_PH/PF01138_21/3_8e14_NODE_760_length_2023_cov_26_120464_g571_i010752019